jgi:molybdenum cofactor guanylyltransferase
MEGVACFRLKQEGHGKAKGPYTPTNARRMVTIREAEPHQCRLGNGGGEVMSERQASNTSGDFGAPVLAVCGFSGSGKTTLLERAIPRLMARRLSVAVIKHDAHGFDVDRPGRDSDRLFRSGATVSLRGPSEQFQRRGSYAALSLEATLVDLARDHDLVLVEGHKDTQLPKVWVCNEQNSAPPAEVVQVERILPWDSERVGTFLSFIETWLPQAWNAKPVLAGLLVGGMSFRIGSPKQLISLHGKPLFEIVATALSRALVNRNRDIAQNEDRILRGVVVLGGGAVPPLLQDAPRLIDAPDLVGPVAGLLAAHRWNPRAAWILAACDYPWLDQSDVEWLLDYRRPGTWAVIPVQPDGYPCSTFALFEPQSLEVLERLILERSPRCARIADLVGHPHTLTCSQSRRGLISTNTREERTFASELGSDR